MSEKTRAKPGSLVAAHHCGFTDDEGEMCGAPAVYEIRFSDWPLNHYAGSCAEHATAAREMSNLARIWTP